MNNSMNNYQLVRFWLRRGVLIAGLLLFLSISFWVVGREWIGSRFRVLAGAPQQFILVVHDSVDDFDEELFTNTTLSLDYARLNYDSLDLAKARIWPRLGQYSALLFVAEDLEKIDEAQAQKIIDYVANGGGLAVVYRGWSPDLAPLFGLPAGTRPSYVEDYETETGLRFHTDFIRGVKGLALGKENVPGHSLFDIQLPVNSPVQVIASSESGRPLAWLNRYGQGRTIFWNTDVMATRDARGFIVQSALSVQPVGVLPMANFATIEIDDFPAAASTNKLEPIKTEYDMTMVEFYDKVWVPDILELARRYGIVYTFLIPFNYNPWIEPPFDFLEWEHAKVNVDNQELIYSVYVSQFLEQGHELGLHGYNHVSLILDGWVVDRETWAYAKSLLSAQELLSTWEKLKELSAKEEVAGLSIEEQAEKAEAEKLMAKAVTKKRTEAEILVATKKKLDQLSAKAQERALTPKEEVDRNLAEQKVVEAGEQKMAQAQALVSMSDEEIAERVMIEARVVVVDVSEAQMAAAEAIVAEAEQKAEENMALALKDASKRWDEDSMGRQPVAYVPPNNLFHPAGARALTEGFPSLKILAGVYSGEFERGGEREFGPEPWNPDLFAIPRVTSGYTLTPSSRFTMASILGMMGVWTYFSHPDDMFHTPQNYPLSSYHRNPNSLPWRGDHTGKKDGLYYHFVEWLDFAAEHYPWLRYVRMDESLELLKAHLENQVTVDLKLGIASGCALAMTCQEAGEIGVYASTPTYLQVRVNNGDRVDLNSLQGAQFVDLHEGEGYKLYTLRGIKANVQFKLLPAPAGDLPPAWPPVVATPSFEQVEENVLDLQSKEVWGMAPVETVAPTPSPVPTVTPAFDVLPMPTPTLRSQ